MTKKLSAGMKFFSVILGALMGGFMWRCRGDGGWGSSWGLYGVGFVLMLLVYHFYSNRTGMKFEMIPLGAFFLGLVVLLFLALTADKHTVRTGYDDTPLFSDNRLSFVFNFVFTVFIMCVAPARVVAIRFARLLEKHEILPDDEPLATILIVVISVVMGIFVIKILRKNILEKGSNAFDMSPVDFAYKALPAYLIMCFLAYFFLDDIDILNIRIDVTVPMMLITSALIAIIYIPIRRKLKK